MKVRIKFAKLGAMKFVGHLDIMRYFQKAIRRANIPIAYSEGFSPHMIMSFAAPLGVGLTSGGEYFDMELAQPMATEEIKDCLNKTMVEGMEVISAKKVEDGKASKAMSLVAAADYEVEFRDGREFTSDWADKLQDFYGRASIVVFKKTKRSEKDVDIKPYIYKLCEENGKIQMQLAAGSSNNTKPQLVMEGFAAYLGVEADPFAYTVHRKEVYADLGDAGTRKLAALEDLGEDVE